MTLVTLREAEKRLDELMSAAESGEEVVITRGDKAAVRLTPVPIPGRAGGERTSGTCQGQIWMADDFDAPLEDFKEYME